MNPITEQKCPKCGAPMRFDPGSGLLVCDNCGNWITLDEAGKAPEPKQEGTEQPYIPADTAQIDGLNMDQLLAEATDPDAADLPVYNCVSCGAEVIAPPEQVALTCPYCRNNIVLTNKVSGKLRPDGVIPFKIQSKDLSAAVRRFYRGKILLPPGFFSEARMGKVTGVYVPFWVFDGRMSGTLYYRGVRSKSSNRGDYIVTETKYYSFVREAALDFQGLPVDAGSKMDDRLMDSLEPFDTGAAKAFDMGYLAGFTADRFDQSDSDLSDRAKARMYRTVQSLTLAQASSGYSSVDPRGQSLHSELNAKYLLFPVYMFDVSHRGRNYHFAVNGQTGKVVGELPEASSTAALYFAKRAGLVSAAILAFDIILYLAGH